MRAHLLVLVAFVGCASVPRGVAPASAPALFSGGGAEADELVAAFYGSGLQPDAALTRAEALLRSHPDSSRAHEVAAFAALLLGDNDTAWLHFLRAAADTNADATELYLWELIEGTRAQSEVTVQLLDQLRRHHPRASVRTQAALHQARIDERLGRFAEADALVASVGVIRDWQMLGALDNDQGKGFLTAYPPEQHIDLAAEVPGPLVPLRWRKVDRLSRMGSVPLTNALWPRDFGVAYLATWVRSDGERTAQLRISTGSPTRVFCNDGLVLSEEQVASGDADNLIAPITLHAGWNQILVKSANRRGYWMMRAHITDGDGAPLTGLSYSSAPQQYQAGAARENADTLRSEPPIGGPAERRLLLDSQNLMRAGRVQRALPAAQELLDAQPSNLLAQYFGALVYWENEELGKTIDLLNQGVKATSERAAAFLTRRGRYYEQKQLWEKAQTDLLAANALGSRMRNAQMALAELFEKRGWQVDRCRMIELMLQRWPDYAWALRERAECLDAQGYPEAAARASETATALEPGDWSGWSERFELARRRGDLAGARKAAEAILRIDPMSMSWRVELGDLSRRRGDWQSARAFFEDAARMEPESPRPWERLGNLDYERGAREQALGAWKRAHERDPNNSTLAQRIEYLEPVKLGFIEKWVPTEAEIDAALGRKFRAHPNAQVALLYDHEVTEVNADGSARRVVTQVSQALDEKGRDALTREHLPTAGALKILRAYSITEKGERQEASSIRGGEVRFRNMAVGSKTVIQYIHYAPVAHFLPGSFASSWFFQSVSRQHEDSTWVLVLPRGHALHVQTTGNVSEKRSVEGDREVRLFHAAHLPPLIPEEHMPPPGDLLAQVDVSTVDGWDDYVRWERALLTDAFRSNSSLDALTDKLMAGAKSPREKLDRLFHHVAEEIRYQQDYESTIAGVRPHAAPVVVERGYGDCKDKAVLLIQMARRAGIKLHFAILRTTPAGRVQREVPNQQFNHAIVWVPKQEGIDQPMFMDPTSDGLDMGNLRSDDQGALSLVMDPQSGKWEFREIPYQAADLQYDHHKIRIEVKSPTEALVGDEMSVRGGLAMGLRHLLRNQGEARKLFEQLAAALFPGTTLRDAKSGGKEDIWHPLGLTIELDGSQAIRPEDEHWRLSLPGSFRLSSVVTLKKRDTPLKLGAPDSSEYDVDALLPDGYQVVHAPKDFVIAHGCFTFSRKAKVEPRRITVHVEYARRCTEVEVADYAAFRESVLEVVHRFDDDLVFGKLAPPAAEPAPKRKSKS